MMRFLLCIALLALPMSTRAQLVETRYCGTPTRDADGSIHRSSAVIAAFKRAHPCPGNQKTSSACPGWAIDHVIPLICGGCDSVPNMAWMPNAIKSGPGTLPKDRWEQRVYCKESK